MAADLFTGLQPKRHAHSNHLTAAAHAQGSGLTARLSAQSCSSTAANLLSGFEPRRQAYLDHLLLDSRLIPICLLQSTLCSAAAANYASWHRRGFERAGSLVVAVQQALQELHGPLGREHEARRGMTMSL